MAERSTNDFFSRSMINKVNRAEATEGKYLFEIQSNDIEKKVFQPSRILDLTEVDVIFPCHFCFKKKSYDIKKEKHNSGRADS